MLVWTLAAAQAATPTPDRPSVSRGGMLVAPHTLELELGAQWAGASSVPATLKYSIAGAVEPRVSANLTGVEAGMPGLLGGAKIRLYDADRTAVALWAGSAIPVSNGEGYRAELHGLLTTSLSQGIGLQFNGGIDLGGDDDRGMLFLGAPLVGAVSYAPAGKVSTFAELAGRVGGPGCEDASCAYGDLIIDGGIGFLLTEVLMIDGGLGWMLRTEQPYAQLGLSANFGSVR